MESKEKLKKMSLDELEKEWKKAWDYFKLVDVIKEAKKNKVL